MSATLWTVERSTSDRRSTTQTQDPVFNPRCRRTCTDALVFGLGLARPARRDRIDPARPCADQSALVPIHRKHGATTIEPHFFWFLLLVLLTGTFSGRGRERRARRGAARGLGGSVGRRRGTRVVFSSSFVVAFRRVRSRRTHRRRRISRGAPIDSSIHPSWRRSRWRSSASSVRARLGKRTGWSAVSSHLEARAREAR